MGQTGCVSFMFDQKGIIIIENEDMDEDEITMDALEAGADDIEVEDGVAEIEMCIRDRGITLPILTAIMCRLARIMKWFRRLFS